MTYYRRRTPELWEEIAAAAAGAAAGLAAYWVARTLFRREPLSSGPDPEDRDGGEAPPAGSGGAAPGRSSG